MFYVGFDASTQSLTATVIEVSRLRRQVIFEESLDFDRAFPWYGTTRGVVTRGAVATAPPAMWAEALDTMMARLGRAVEVKSIAAMSGSAQQHGSVYLAAGFQRVLRDLAPSTPLVRQLDGIFTRPQSPVWLDCSAAADCAALSKAVGGPEALAALTGSPAFERFTAAQIRKFAREAPDAYRRTERIHLVSSFMASLLCGKDAPVEPGDGSGMNLMDIRARRWAPVCAEATAPDLIPRLPAIRESPSIAGALAPYWQSRYRFPQAPIVAWSGDNPSSLIGLGLVAGGELGISLGTSDTVFALAPDCTPDPGATGHLFGAPTGGCMALTCFANGSLARERIRDAYGLDWGAFSACLERTAPGNDGGILVPWFAPEITPKTAMVGPHRLELEASDPARNVRAVVEAQAMSMRIYSRWFCPRAGTIRVTGGAAVNREILQVIADVFDAPVVRIAPPNAASLGAALRALHAERLAAGRPLSWPDTVEGFTDPVVESGVSPRRAAVRAYHLLLPRYEAFLQSLIPDRGGRPERPVVS